MAGQATAQRVFVGLVALSIVLVGVVAAPIAQALFLAAVLAGALQGVEERLTRVLRGRSGVAAATLCVGFVVALLAPFAGLVAFVVGEVIVGIRFVSEVLRNEGVGGLVDRVPGPVRGPVRRLLVRAASGGRGLEAVLQQALEERGTSAAGAVGDVVSATGSFAFQLAMMLIALFFFLRDGRRLVAWLESVSPLRPGQTSELLREFRSVSVSVLLSSLATAGVQAAAALVGFLIARVPVPLFFTSLTFVLALVPALGGTAGCLTAALLLFATGHAWAALFLTIWGLLVVGLVDNVIKPLLVRRGLNMHGAIVFFALLGGLTAFGPVGLLLGPLVVSFFLAVLRIYERDFGRPAEKPGATAPADPDATGGQP